MGKDIRDRDRKDSLSSDDSLSRSDSLSSSDDNRDNRDKKQSNNRKRYAFHFNSHQSVNIIFRSSSDSLSSDDRNKSKKDRRDKDSKDSKKDKKKDDKKKKSKKKISKDDVKFFNLYNIMIDNNFHLIRKRIRKRKVNLAKIKIKKVRK